MQLGYDGALIEEDSLPGERGSRLERVWVAFKPNQIKSASSNDGTWDADDPDIRSNPGVEAVDEVAKIATRVRKELEKECGKNTRNRCISASEKLNDLLRDAGFDSFVVDGIFREGRRGLPHVWVEVDPDGKGDIIVDVTADQFGDFPQVWLDADLKYYYGYAP